VVFICGEIEKIWHIINHHMEIMAEIVAHNRGNPQHPKYKGGNLVDKVVFHDVK
jgi:hypothetical protein